MKKVLRLLRRSVIAALCIYWLIFFCYTTENLVRGGPAAAINWYKYVAIHSGLLVRWNWRSFLASQLAILGIMLILCFWERRTSRRSHLS